MPTPILMPALSPTMEAGTLAKWHVKEGDAVVSGDVIAEIETDKATMEVEAVDEGTVGKLVVDEGAEDVKVNALIAVLLEEGESADDIDEAELADAGPAPGPSDEGNTDTAEEDDTEKKADDDGASADSDRERATQSNGAAEEKSDGGKRKAPSDGGGERIFASPLARRLAQQNDIDLTALSGSGPHGRIIKKDIEKALKDGVPEKADDKAAAASDAPAAPAPAAAQSDKEILALYEEGTYEVEPHDGMRKIIAQRLQQSKQTVPHFYLSIDCELDNLLEARKRFNDLAPKDKEGAPAYKLSVNDFVIKALAVALQRVPDANATWTEGGMLKHTHSDVGVAVAVEGGLFTPVIRKAEGKGLAAISNEMKDLAGRARKRRLSPEEYQGGTTAVSNLGMYGISHFSAVINPPHGTILAVGAGERKPVASGDEIVVRTIMTVTLSCDHRAVDGALGAELLGAFKACIEEPGMMLV